MGEGSSSAFRIFVIKDRYRRTGGVSPPVLYCRVGVVSAPVLIDVSFTVLIDIQLTVLAIRASFVDLPTPAEPHPQLCSDTPGREKSHRNKTQHIKNGQPAKPL